MRVDWIILSGFLLVQHAIERPLDERVGERANRDVHLLTEVLQRELPLIVHIEQEHQLRQLANRATLEISKLVETFYCLRSVPGCDDAKLPVNAPQRKNRHTPSAFLGNDLGDNDHILPNENQ